MRVIFEQALPTPVAAGYPEDASALLTRASGMIVNSIRRLPKYTCLETVDRAYYALPREKRRPHMMTEAPPAIACVGNRGGHLSLEAKDRLRVEVAVAGGNEIHSWPGAGSFESSSFDRMIPFGPISTGSFGTTLFDVFENPGAQIKFTARKTVGTREIFEYSFRADSNASHYYVKERGRRQVTAFSGSFAIDAATAELTRLEIETALLPPEAEMCRAKISTDYHFTLIGDGEFLIPLRSQFDTFDIDGGQTDSITEFSACREYQAESSLRFDNQDTSVREIKTTPQRVIPLPPGVSLTLALVGVIDLGTAAAGDQVSAKVVHSVHALRSKKILVPADAIARDRILVMRHATKTSEFLISIRFDTLEIKGAVSPLKVRLAREIKAERRSHGGFATGGTEFSLPAATSPESGGRFVFPAKRGAYVIPAGFQSEWSTVSP